MRTGRPAPTPSGAAGAGHPHALGLRTRLLLALVWLRVYPAYELLGWLFGLDKSNAWHNAQDVPEVLDTMTVSPRRWPLPPHRGHFTGLPRRAATARERFRLAAPWRSRLART